MNGDPDRAAASLDGRYHRVVRRARWRRLIPALCAGAAIYLPTTKGEVRFLGLDHLSWSDAVQKTVLWLLIMAFLWMLPLEWNPAPSGYQGLDRQDRATVDSAVRNARPPEDGLLRRVADEYAKRLMRAGEPGRKHAISLGLAAVVACGLATQWWALALWLALIVCVAVQIWRRRGLAAKAERYLTAPRRFISGDVVAELFKDAPPVDADAFRRDLDELIDQDPSPRV